MVMDMKCSSLSLQPSAPVLFMSLRVGRFMHVKLAFEKLESLVNETKEESVPILKTLERGIHSHDRCTYCQYRLPFAPV